METNYQTTAKEAAIDYLLSYKEDCACMGKLHEDDPACKCQMPLWEKVDGQWREIEISEEDIIREYNKRAYYRIKNDPMTGRPHTAKWVDPK